MLILEDKGLEGHVMGLSHEVECKFVPLLRQVVRGPLQKGMGRASRSLLW